MGIDFNENHCSGALTISSSETPEFNLKQTAAVVAVYCVDASSLTFTLSGTIDGTTWINIPSWNQTGTPTAAGSAHTASTSNVIFAAVPGFTKIRAVRVAGSGTIQFASSLASLTAGSMGIGGTSGSGALTTTTPAVANATSVTVLAANPSRRALNIQNNLETNIMVSVDGAALTGIVPTDTNIGFVLYPGDNLGASIGDYVPTGAITVYQTSGSSTRLITVGEG